MKPRGNPTPPPGGARDREVFERVWRRVMPEDREGCPLAVGPLSDQQGQPVSQTGQQVQAETKAETALVLSSNGAGALGSDFPDLQDVPCLGSRGVGSVPLLQAMIAQELRDMGFYQTLSRRIGGSGARTFSALAADELRHAKRLSAAHFLISGVRYWPEPRGKVALGSYLSALRQRFIAEQNGAAAYQAAAADCPDPCLRELFLEIAQEENNHASLIRSVVEQL